MYVYHLVNGVTGERLEQLEVKDTPSWVRRPEPVTWSATFDIRPNPQDSWFGVVEGNPMVGLQHRIHPYLHAIVVSWRAPDGSETALAAGIIARDFSVNESAGSLTVRTICLRTFMDDRFLLRKDMYPMTGSSLPHSGLSAEGMVAVILDYATRDFEAIPEQNIAAVEGFGLPIDRPPKTTGSLANQWWGYNFKQAAEALEDVEEEAEVVIDFRPYWTAGLRLRWSAEVFSNTGRTGQLIDLGSTGAIDPQATYGGTTEDWTDFYTVTHHTGKGSEADILYVRKSDITPTTMAREVLLARPDIETSQQLDRQKIPLYFDARSVQAQDQVRIRVDRTNTDWVHPTDLRVGQAVQLTIADSLYYGHQTIRRVLIGWSSSGDRTIDLELQALEFDSGV